MKRLWLYDAILNFGLDGELPETNDDVLLDLWECIKPGLDSHKSKSTNKKAEAARKNGLKGGRPRKQKEEEPPRPQPEQTAPGNPGTANDGRGRGRRPQPRKEPPETSTASKKEPPTAPAPPTLEEVKRKATELGATHVNCKKFFHCYEGKKWSDSNGNPIDWINKLLEWEAEEEEKQKPTKTPNALDRQGAFGFKLDDEEERPKNRKPRPGTEEPEYGVIDDDLNFAKTTQIIPPKKEPEKPMKPDEYIRSKGYDPKVWGGKKYPEFLAMMREKDEAQPPNQAV